MQSTTVENNFSQRPSYGAQPLYEAREQLRSGNTYDLEGPAGTTRRGPYWHLASPHSRPHDPGQFCLDTIGLFVLKAGLGPEWLMWSIPIGIDEMTVQDGRAWCPRLGTAAFFNLSALHAATVRPCTRERKSVQV